MKKALGIAFVLFAIFSLAACGSNTSSEASSIPSSSSSITTQSSEETISSSEDEEEFSIETSSSSEIEYSSIESISSSEEEESSYEEETSSSESERTNSSDEMEVAEDSDDTSWSRIEWKDDSTYHVTFQNYDGTKLYETDVEEGQAAHYEGETPIRPADESTYEFIGWNQSLTNITSDLVVKAVYREYAVDKEEGWGPGHWA